MRDPFRILNTLEAAYVLDVATGRGDFIKILRDNLKSYIKIIGVDSSDKNVDRAQKLFPENDIEIYQMNLESLRLDDNTFDLVTIADSLHHLENMEAIFSEMLRVLKPGGSLLVMEMYSDGDQTDAQQTHIMLHNWLAAIDRKLGVYHHNIYMQDEILSFMNKLGLDDLVVDAFYHPVDNPKDAKNCETLKRTCQESFKRLESLEDNEELIAEGDSLLDRINNVGCASASKLLIKGIKPLSNKKENLKEK
jgi:ubiquinone/menaquinone biosynthesis C-methylase UbiE